MEKIEFIVKWLKEQLIDSGTDGYVLGLSGGLDSAVCAGLISKATSNALGLIIPIESDPVDIEDARHIAGIFDLKCELIELLPVYRDFVKIMPDGNKNVQGNLKTRLRMIILYYYANLKNLMVCGTGNKSEILLGYFTKYGDGASDVLPLGDLYKYQVRELAREIGIPEKVIGKTPSAGLWPGQTDEGEIGFSYQDIDSTLRDMLDCRAAGKCAQELKEMIAHSEHKRNPPKICILPNRGVA